MSKLPKIASLFMLMLFSLSMIQQLAAPVAAVEPQQPSNPGTWSQDFGLYGKFLADGSLNGSIPLLPMEWNGRLYAILNGHQGSNSGIGYWNGQQWIKLDGLSGFVEGLTVHQERLYVVGRLTLAGKTINVAYWDGTLWTAMPTQLIQHSPLFVASYANQLYVGGENVGIDGQTYGTLARWDGEQWHAAAEGIDGIVCTILVRPDGLYLGGSFMFNGQKTALLYWNGSQWQTVGGGLHGYVFDLEWADSQLYISGQFTSTLEPTLKNIAAWNGTSWNSFGNGVGGSVHNVALFDNDLYILTKSTTLGGNAYEFQRWNGTQWTKLANLSRMSSELIFWFLPPSATLVTYDNQLHLFGMLAYRSAASEPINQGNSALRWNGTQWESMYPNGISNFGDLSMTTDGDDLFVAGGEFSWGYGEASLARFGSNQRWQPIVETAFIRDSVQLLESFQQSFFVVSNNTLYQNGTTTWNQVGAERVVQALAKANSRLYVGGDFAQFNGVTAHNLVTWDGSQWQAFNAPASFDKVVIIETYGNKIYISDGFKLARWDDTQWTMLASNVVNIGEIEPTADGVYIAGTFSSVAGVLAPQIAYWNGSTWSGLNGTISGSILDLEMGADGLYVAGNFRGLTNGIVSGGILRWDGAMWHGVGGGVQKQHYVFGTNNGIVQRLAATPTHMYLNGNFDMVGNEYESFRFAAWAYGNEPLIRAKNDYAISYRPQAVTVNVLANDWSDQPSQLQLVSVTPPSHGTATISGTQIVYRPYPQFTGLDTLTYTVRDPIHALTTTAQVRLHVWNNPSVVLHDVYLPAVIR
ncbi:Ig-like domain-containing protein [Herpetosiphon sp. NSE202]|uniref:Ig-like domain-containing protein n=1 Tax=Herpetosiphon sp. NSE202 TaxID=3351349 RepID=UPI0036301420